MEIGKAMKSSFYIRGTTSLGMLRTRRNAHKTTRTMAMRAEMPPRARRKKRKEG